jgi:hypothetical protein
VRQLFPHDPPRPDRPAQGRLVDHGPQLGRARLGEHPLPGQPQVDPPLDFFGRHPAPPDKDDAACVVLGLQQAGDELDLIGAQVGRRLLQPQVHLEPRRQQVGVLLPPARPVGLPHQPEELGPLLRVGDAVEREQVRDVTLLEPDPPELEPADLGVEGADRVARGLPADATRLAQPAQLRAEHDAQHGGPTVQARTGRRLTPDGRPGR